MAGLLDEEDLMPFFGNPNIQRQGAKARALAAKRDVNTLPDPKTYAAMQGLLGTAPDQMGFSVLNPNYQAIMDVANPSYGLGIAAQLSPILAPLTKGLPVGAGIVWHGTPHRFPPTARNPLGEFDASKIGTGEGAQAYGHGIYTGGNIKTGKEYVKTTARTEVVDASGNTLYKEAPKRKVTGESRAADALDYAFQIQSSNPYAFAANQVRRFGEGPNVQDALKTLEQWEKSGARTRSGGGYLYKADLPDEKIAQMIDWYYPVQEDVRQKVSSAALEKFGSGSTGTSGAHLYAELSKEFERIGVANPKVAASEFLRQQGVPGIKYLDNFSRRQPEWIIQSPQGGQNIFNSEAGALEFLQRNPQGTMIPPSQTHNYVMFPGEEQNIKILQREEFGGLLGQ